MREGALLRDDPREGGTHAGGFVLGHEIERRVPEDFRRPVSEEGVAMPRDVGVPARSIDLPDPVRV